MDKPNQRFVCRRGAAEYLKSEYGVGSAKTLAKLATNGQGPKFRKLGARVIYAIGDIDDWAQSRMSAPMISTADIPTPATSPARRGPGRPPKAARAGGSR